MYARISIGIAKPDKMNEIDKVVRDSILPAAKKQKGFKGFYHLADNQASKGMILVLWNTEADMTTGESSTYYKEQVAKIAPYLTASPTIERYEVRFKA